MNTYTTIGRLTADPIIKTTSSQKKVANFTIAVSTGYGKNKSTMYLDCQAWEGLAEVLQQYTTKGKQIGISGNLQQENWERDGQKRSKIVCNIKSLELLSTKQEKTADANNDLPDLDQAMNDMMA